MFIGRRILEDRAGMQPCLMRKGGGAHEGRLLLRHAVQDIVQHPADPRQLFERLLADAGVELTGIGFLEQQDRDQCRQVCIATTLAQPVQRALNLPCTRVDGGQRCRNCVFGVVVGVDPQMVPRNARRDDRTCDPVDICGQRPPIGVAQRNPPRPCIIGRMDRLQRVVGIGCVAVKEVLGVKDRLAALCFDVGKALRDIGRVFVQRNAERRFDMELMGLAHKANSRRVGVQHGGQHIVVFGTDPGPLGHAKGGERRTRLGRRIKESTVGRVRPGPAPFDIVDAEGVEGLCDLVLFAG
mmetsp:Transcript_26884/g.48655  ORF Transcript_26884/g.48655 Transcript_26884/m.48655 type:complete len:297 (+) Transcript_26884:209-1099(+)